MKIYVLLFILLIRAYACANDLPVLNVYSLNEHDLKAFSKGENSDFIIEFSAQTFLPFSLFLKGNLFHLDEDKFGNVEIKETFYVRKREENLVFSSNLRDWKSFPEFLTGTLSVSVNNEKGNPTIIVGAETELRR